MILPDEVLLVFLLPLAVQVVLVLPHLLPHLVHLEDRQLGMIMMIMVMMMVMVMVMIRVRMRKSFYLLRSTRVTLRRAGRAVLVETVLVLLADVDDEAPHGVGDVLLDLLLLGLLEQVADVLIDRLPQLLQHRQHAQVTLSFSLVG